MSKDELHIFRRQQIEDYRNSGKSAETWCEANAMKVSTLRYWLRRIKDTDQPEPDVDCQVKLTHLSIDG